ncbi:MAG: hypothetical protein M1830_007282 [Pleopsidium flavum]|nr:MAG: hypothetical protein M1830_007282 [Pleopsidium flavum]
MAAIANAGSYGIPPEWVPQKGELGRHGNPGSMSRSDRLILLGTARDANKAPAALDPTQAAAAASNSAEPIRNEPKKSKPMSKEERETRITKIMTSLSGFHNVDSDESEVLPQDKRKGTKIAQHAIPQSMIQKRPGGTPTKTESVQEPAASNAVNRASTGLKEKEQIKRPEARLAKIRAVQEEARKRCVQKSKEEVDCMEFLSKPQRGSL